MFSSLSLFADFKYSCNTEHVIKNNKKYLPPKQLKFFKISIADDGNSLSFITQSYESRYKYKSFIPTSKVVPTLGISFESADRYIDIFNNGQLYLGSTDNNGYMLKANCPAMHLTIREDHISENGETVYRLRLKK